MREIKFRGKQTKNGEWMYGIPFFWSNKMCDIQVEENGYLKVYRVDPNTVGQYTGLKDKNGKEIYEGDIVKTPLLDPIFGDILADAWCNALIRFNQGSFVVSYYNSHNIYLQDLCDKIELLGNIHDNPELLA